MTSRPSFLLQPKLEVPSPHDLNRAIAREGLFGRGTEADLAKSGEGVEPWGTGTLRTPFGKIGEP